MVDFVFRSKVPSQKGHPLRGCLLEANQIRLQGGKNGMEPGRPFQNTVPIGPVTAMDVKGDETKLHFFFLPYLRISIFP